jgi:tetratricopeptide (TPR) repeat protein
MAGRISGITLEINGDTTKLQDALRGVDKSLKDTQGQLRDVNKLLKMDPGNTELLRQKQELLGDAIEQTKEKLEKEKEALKQLEAAGSSDPEAIKQQNALKREIEDTEQSLKSYEKQLKSLPSTLSKVSEVSGQVSEKTKGISLAAGAFGAAMLGNAYKSAQAADDLNTLSKQTGFTVEELQKMQYASDLVDVSMDTMTGSVQKLTKNMASGSDVFDTLGVSITNSDGSMRSAVDVWYDSLQALSQIGNETERDQLSMELFGKSAMDMAGIVDDGGASLKAAGQEAEDLGLILGQDSVDAANRFNDSIDKMKAQTSAAFMEAGASLAETLTPALEAVAKVVQNLAKWFGSLSGPTQAAILVIAGLVAAISPIAGIISAIAGAAAALNIAMAPITGIIIAIIAVVAALVAAGVALYQNWDTICAWATNLKDQDVEAFNNLKDNAITAFNNLKDKASEIFENIKSSITEKIEGAKKIVSDAVEKIKGVFNFSWSLPPIKLPHFHVSGGKAPWGFMGQGSLPSISIEWYKRAYKNAVMFNTPTVLATNSGLMGFGDGAGAETVVGNALLAQLIRENSGAGTLEHISALLEVIARNGTTVTLQGDARQMFKQVRRQNASFTKSTGKSGFDY